MSFHLRPKRLVVLALGCLALLAAACVVLTRPPTVSILRVGYTDFYPYIGRDATGGPTGLAVQLVSAAAVRSGIRLEWLRVEDGEAALRSGEIDLFPLLTITSERRRDLHFSVPWWESGQALMSPGERPIRDFSAAVGKRIAIRDLNPIPTLARRYLPGALVVPVRDARGIISEVCSGRVDGAMLDGRLAYDGLLREPSNCAGHPLELVPVPQITLPMGTASTLAAGKTADRLYAAIEHLALTGQLTELSNRWFVMPQQRYAATELANAQRNRLAAVFIAGAIVLIGLSAWYWQRTLEMRRAAMAAWIQAKEAEDRFDAFMSNTPVCQFIKDAHGRYTYVNQAFLRQFGLSGDDCYGRTNEELFPADVAADMRRSDREVLSGGGPVQYLVQVPCLSGTRHMLALKFLLVDQAGHPCLGGTAIDITDQQRASELVKLSEERYRMLFEEAPVAIHEVGADGRLCRVNRAECEMLGYRAEELLGRHASEFAAPEERDSSLQSVTAKLSGEKKLVTFERRYQRADGRTIPTEVHETLILDPSGAIQGIRTCMIDLTERYEAQARLDRYAGELQEKNAALAEALRIAQEATRLKSQFLANMSHEIRTPLNGVLGMAELLADSELAPDQRELARCVIQSGEHLLNVINDILDVSKIEAGKFELDHDAFDFPAVVEAAIELMAPAAHAKNVELTCWIAPDIPDTLCGDGPRLRQVLLNLVGNAVKFTAQGQVSVSVNRETPAGAAREGGITLRVTVADTGIGIAPGARARLFTAFTQADCSTTRRFGGTGLGLAIAQTIVKLMGGAMGVESEEGKGSTFWFTCNFGGETCGESVPEPTALAGVRVLIADDNADSRSVLERYTRHWGMLPECAASGEEALERMRERASAGRGFQLALVDRQMPGKDGAWLAREIAADPILQSTPVVMLTAMGRPAQLTHVARHQFKPVKRRALFDCVRSVLGGTAAEPGAAQQSDANSAAGPIQAATWSTCFPGPGQASEDWMKHSSLPPAAAGRVLVAEDNQVNQRVARLQLERLGFAVDVVSNGEEALAALERLNYVLVLMDCQMPGMDGYEATRALRSREAGRRRTPVIAMTANAFASDQQACLDAGMDDYLSKPVDLRVLQDKLEQWTAAPDAAV